MLVKEIMKEAVSVTAGETLEMVARRLKNDNVGCLPVCEGKHVLGMITDRDILTRRVANSRDAHNMTAREAMSTEIHCCSGSDPVEQAATIMAKYRVRRLPVLDDKQELIGIVSLTDLTGGASGGEWFEVVFYKEVTDSSGHPHQVELMRVNVGPGHTKEEAISAAIKKMENEKQAAWNIFADGYDVIELRTDQLGRIVEEVEKTSEKEERVRRRAYELWEQKAEGGQEGHWAQASREIEAEDAARKAASETQPR